MISFNKENRIHVNLLPLFIKKIYPFTCIFVSREKILNQKAIPKMGFIEP